MISPLQKRSNQSNKEGQSEHEQSPTNHGYWVLLACNNLIFEIFSAFVLFGPLLVLLISEKGASGLEQRIENNSAPQLRFSQSVYIYPQYSDAQQIKFSSEQKEILGIDEYGIMERRLFCLGYVCFLVHAFLTLVGDFPWIVMAKSTGPFLLLEFALFS